MNPHLEKVWGKHDQATKTKQTLNWTRAPFQEFELTPGKNWAVKNWRWRWDSKLRGKSDRPWQATWKPKQWVRHARKCSKARELIMEGGERDTDAHRSQAHAPWSEHRSDEPSALFCRGLWNLFVSGTFLEKSPLARTDPSSFPLT